MLKTVKILLCISMQQTVVVIQSGTSDWCHGLFGTVDCQAGLM